MSRYTRLANNNPFIDPVVPIPIPLSSAIPVPPYPPGEGLIPPFTDGTTRQYVQPNDRSPEQEKYENDAIIPFADYPFNIRIFSLPITEINLKLSDTTLKISNGRLEADRPIFIEFVGSTLQVWNCKITENAILSTMGNTLRDGYICRDYADKPKKVVRKFEYITWDLPPLQLNRITLHGNSNNLFFEDVLSVNLDIKIYGHNIAKFPSRLYSTLSVSTTYSVLDFDRSTTNTAILQLEGNGTLRGLTIRKTGDLRLVGAGTFLLSKEKDANIREEKFGAGGTIMWA